MRTSFPPASRHGRVDPVECLLALLLRRRVQRVQDVVEDDEVQACAEESSADADALHRGCGQRRVAPLDVQALRRPRVTRHDVGEDPPEDRGLDAVADGADPLERLLGLGPDDADGDVRVVADLPQDAPQRELLRLAYLRRPLHDEVAVVAEGLLERPVVARLRLPTVRLGPDVRVRASRVGLGVGAARGGRGVSPSEGLGAQEATFELPEAGTHPGPRGPSSASSRAAIASSRSSESIFRSSLSASSRWFACSTSFAAAATRTWSGTPGDVAISVSV